MTYIEVCGAAVAEPPGERLRNYEHGKYRARRGVAEVAELAVAYKYLVYNVVQRGDEQRQHARDSEFEHQLSELCRAERGFRLLHNIILLIRGGDLGVLFKEKAA